MRKISLDLIRVTESAAISASKWVGSGNKLMADKAATEAMRTRLNDIDFAAEIAAGEGIKDNSYGIFSGEIVGRRWLNNSDQPVEYEISIDPVEGTTPTVMAGPEAISTLAIAHKGTMLRTEHYYMHKIAYGRKIKEKVKLQLEDPIEKTISLISSATGKKNDEIFVCVLNRPRHDKVIEILRELGVRIKLIQDCDVSGAVAACMPDSGIDLLYGIGGAPESVISACAIKCLKGDFQSQVSLEDDNWKLHGPVFQTDDLIKGECIFVATGITDGSLLHGVKWDSYGPLTNSIFMRSKSGTWREISTHHRN